MFLNLLQNKITPYGKWVLPWDVFVSHSFLTNCYRLYINQLYQRIAGQFIQVGRGLRRSPIQPTAQSKTSHRVRPVAQGFMKLSLKSCQGR